jgi:SRSO17 transposase
MRVTAPDPPAADSLARLDDFAALFRADFRRRDQARWAAVYLRGLLLDAGRKNIETIGRRAAVPADLSAEDPVQALQNFINQSPWDEQKLLRRYRTLVDHRAGGGAVVVSDVAFPKQGRQSVGVQRQYSREHRRKINCQVAVALHYLSDEHQFPLALRLYLPRGWVRTPERLAACGVPAEFHAQATRGEIALALLDEVGAHGVSVREVIPGPGYEDSQEFRAGLAERGLAEAPAAARPHGLRRAEDVCRQMKARLGLDHFEGRSWRGFHHHAALTMLAYAFLRLEESDWIDVRPSRARG